MNQAKISIRPAAEGDAAAVAKVHVQAWRETYHGLLPAEELANLSESGRAAMWTKILAQQNTAENHVFGAWMDDRLTGFINGGMARSEIENADSELYAIYVLQAVQRQQVGRRLFRTLTSRLFTGGHRRMFLWVLEGNPSAGFYERMGGRRGPSQETTIGGRRLTELSYIFELSEFQDIGD